MPQSKFRLKFTEGQLIPPSEHLHYVREDQMKPDKNNPNKKRRWIIVEDDRNNEQFSAQLESIRSGGTTRSPGVRRQQCSEVGKNKENRIKRGLTGRKYNIGDIVGPDKNLLILEDVVSDTTKRKCKFKNLDNGKIFIGCLTNATTGQLTGISGSLGENRIKKILEDTKISFIQEYKFKDFATSKHGKPRYDFYLPDYNCCIEYDGIQHFKESKWNTIHNSLAERQARDKIKDEYCLKNNIKLIRIPYWDYDKLNEQYLKELLCIS